MSPFKVNDRPGTCPCRSADVFLLYTAQSYVERLHAPEQYWRELGAVVREEPVVHSAHHLWYHDIRIVYLPNRPTRGRYLAVTIRTCARIYPDLCHFTTKMLFRGER